ncbi:MAG: ribosome maturation factor RimM [Oscillospiraceae bacterium]|nr:ribosome maturation factor RimM [Oscillospiraceae bacterium]
MDNCDNYIEAGKITAPHSFKGDVKIYSWCDSIGFLMQFKILYLDRGKKPLEVIRMRKYKNNMIVASFSGVENEAGALSLKNEIVYINKNDIRLEEGVFFIADLIGLPVFDFNSGEKYGVLADVFSNGANDVYVIDRGVSENGKPCEAMIPNVPEFIKKVSLEEGVFISPIEGMF